MISCVSRSSGLDQAAYDVEQKCIETEIELFHETLVRRISHLCSLTAVIPNYTQAAVNDKISNMALVNENFTVLRAQVEDLEIRDRSNRTSRTEIFDQIVTLQRGIQMKVITVVQSPFSSDTASIL